MSVLRFIASVAVTALLLAAGAVPLSAQEGGGGTRYPPAPAPVINTYKPLLPVTAQEPEPAPAAAETSGEIYLDMNAQTHPPLRLTPDKSEILILQEEASRIVVGNDTHVNVLMDTAKRLIVVPRAPGATHFIVLDEDGAALMQRHVIVASPKEDYLRVRRSCGGLVCEATTVYYCPDMCHSIHLDTGSGAPGTSGGAAADAGADAAGELIPAAAGAPPVTFDESQINNTDGQ